MMITNSRCRAVEGWLREVHLPPGDKPWSLTPTPIPELPEAEEVEIEETVTLETAQLMAANGVSSISVERVSERLQEMHERIRQEKTDFAKKATKNIELHIEDELREGNFYQVLSEFITDLSTFPTAFMGGPFVKRRQKLVWTEDQEGNLVPAVDLTYRREYEAISPFDMFPSPGARTLQDGYLNIRRRLRRSDLNALIGVKGYSEEAIRGVLEEHGNGGLRDWMAIDQERAELEDRPHELDDPDPPIDAVEFWGSVQGSKLLEWGMSEKQVPDAALDYNVNAWLIGQWVIMARLNSSPLGRRPFYSASFETVNGSIWGKSPPELMRDVQSICNATARNLINNLAIASGPQVEVNVDRLSPGEDAEDQWPWKIWKVIEDPTGHGKPALQFFQPNPLTAMLLKVYQYFFDQASEQSGIPAHVYGSKEVGGGAGKTASGLAMMMNAATKTLKDVVVHVDTGVIRPAIKEHWTHVMLYDKDVLKIGDINVVARASEYLIMQEQLQIRYGEALDKSKDGIDLAIIGPKGRAKLLREYYKLLKVRDDVVPPDTELETMFPGPGAPVAPDQATGLPIPDNAVIDAAGARPGGETLREAA